MVTKKILILTANPKDTSRLQLDQEVSEIEKGLERSQRREQFEIISRWAVRAEDLRRSLLDLEPEILHFSGHGGGSEGLLFASETGKAKLASAEALANLFALFEGKIECVILNACYSEVQAEAIYAHVDYVIGMNEAIGDRAAVAFSVGFYDALGAGRSFEDAYKFGCSAIDFEDGKQRLTPALKSRHDPKLDVNPSETVSTPELEQPEGQVPLDSNFYVERPPIEQDCYEAIVKSGALIRVKAARQMGKTSLMSRILAHGRSHEYQAVPLYFQEAEGEIFSDLKACLQWFCYIIADELGLSDDVEECWKGALGNKRKCTNYLQQHVLSKIESPLVLGLDEVDLVFQHLNIAKEFFALLRTWHERGKNEPLWKKLRLVIVHSKEVYIPLDMRQSPFNVGLPIELPEFSPAQLQMLAQRHGLTLTETDIQRLVAMVGGHPYLVRVALYELARGRCNLAGLLEVAPTEEGPYDDHLRRHLRNLINNPNLVTAMGQVIEAEGPTQIGSEIGSDETFQLRSMGLVKIQRNTVVPLCDLYRHYFLDRLRT